MSTAGDTADTPTEDTPTESETRRKIRALLEQGFTVREIAGLLGISTQRVHALRRKMGLGGSS